MIQAVRGTKDILPEEVNFWHFVQNSFNKISSNYGYQELRTPIFEKTEVFHRSIGEATDIVNKEMYTFTDKGNESITLRPEQTAALVRAVIQSSLMSLNSIQRLWYFGPYFRYERPQKGRLRQFHQYGAECLGSVYPEADVEIILLANSSSILILNLSPTASTLQPKDSATFMVSSVDPVSSTQITPPRSWNSFNEPIKRRSVKASFRAIKAKENFGFICLRII